MKGIMKVFFLLVAIFSTSFVLNLRFEWITVESVRAGMEVLRSSPDATLWIALAVIAILSIDSVLAVPTITTIVLAGYFLGPVVGGLAASAGVMIAGSICFLGTRYGGDRVLRFIVSPQEAARLGAWFESSGGLALLLSRSLPMLPEVLSCLAGMSRMRMARYYLLFALGNVPFAMLASFAGSRSALEKPWPALVVGMGVPALAYIVWWLYGRRAAKESRRISATESATLRPEESGSLELRLEIEGLEQERPGRLYVYLFGREGFPKDHPAARERHVLDITGNLPATRLEARIITRLAGHVAFKIVHDEEERGGMRKRFGFVPDFGIGYSNGARITHRPPRFEEAALLFDAGVEVLRVPVRMQYLLGPRTRPARAAGGLNPRESQA